jgi:adenylate cyclase class 2
MLMFFDMENPKNLEIEARFLEINKPALIKKLLAFKAKDFGESLLEEIIFFEKSLSQKWWVRLRKYPNKMVMTYKNRTGVAVDSTEEIEFEISDLEKAKIFLEKIGLKATRIQEKKRHSLLLGDVMFDIDTWPKVPTLVELEGPSETSLKKASKAVGLDWRDARFEAPREIIETRYGIPVGKLSFYTFKKIK